MFVTQKFCYLSYRWLAIHYTLVLLFSLLALQLQRGDKNKQIPQFSLEKFTILITGKVLFFTNDANMAKFSNLPKRNQIYKAELKQSFIWKWWKKPYSLSKFYHFWSLTCSLTTKKIKMKIGYQNWSIHFSRVLVIT